MLDTVRRELPKKIKNKAEERRRALVKELLSLTPGEDGLPDARGLIDELRRQVLESALSGELLIRPPQRSPFKTGGQ